MTDAGSSLENPLTVDGLIRVENMIRDYLTTKKAATDAVIEWADFYKDELDFPPDRPRSPEGVTARAWTTSC